MDNPSLFEDDIYLRCISLAKEATTKIRFGSILVSSGNIVGYGRNRGIAHQKFIRPRIERQGYANHAEIEALNMAFMFGNDVDGSILYVAGYYSDGLLYFKEKYTCPLCPPILIRHGVSAICVPTQEGWVKKEIYEAYEEGKAFRKGTYDKRRNIAQGNYTIDELVLPDYDFPLTLMMDMRSRWIWDESDKNSFKRILYLSITSFDKKNKNYQI